MLHVQQIKIAIPEKQGALEKAICKKLHLRPGELLGVEIRRKSLDARKKPLLYYVYDVHVLVPEPLQKKLQKQGFFPVSFAEGKYQMPLPGKTRTATSPVIVGTGPAGLFAGYLLAEAGYKPILIERGESVHDRRKTVERFWASGQLNPESNVQFGEGGAGTFSDGKLNTMIKDPTHRIRKVLETFCRHGANEEILYASKPHIGTDALTDIVCSMREQIIENGGTFRFSTKMTNIILEDFQVSGIVLNDEEVLPCNQLILALGHSSRDTFQWLYQKGLPLTAKSFAMGLRIIHDQHWLNETQYGKGYPLDMPAAEYKVTAKTREGRGVYSFCMCPGGYVVNASSAEGMLSVNGMSYGDRKSPQANSAIIVTVRPEDFPLHGPWGQTPLAGMQFQEDLEKAAYELAGGAVPVQRFSDFSTHQKGNLPEWPLCIKGDYASANIRDAFPAFLMDAIEEGIWAFQQKMPGFAHPDACLMAFESRTSSPVRMPRGEDGQCIWKGVYPCGEGAGYAGGITSAACDGLRIAEHIIEEFAPLTFF